MDYATTDAETIATAIAADIGRTVDYRPVTNDGATRAASLIQTRVRARLRGRLLSRSAPGSHVAAVTVGCAASSGGEEDGQVRTDEAAAIFAELRPYLHGVAYRLTSSWADAEDVVADAWPR
jgi:hypothetical protein